MGAGEGARTKGGAPGDDERAARILGSPVSVSEDEDGGGSGGSGGSGSGGDGGESGDVHGYDGENNGILAAVGEDGGGISFGAFVAYLAHFAEAALGKYPFDPAASSMGEKVRILLERFDLSHRGRTALGVEKDHSGRLFLAESYAQEVAAETVGGPGLSRGENKGRASRGNGATVTRRGGGGAIIVTSSRKAPRGARSARRNNKAAGESSDHSLMLSATLTQTGGECSAMWKARVVCLLTRGSSVTFPNFFMQRTFVVRDTNPFYRFSSPRPFLRQPYAPVPSTALAAAS